MNSEVHSLTFQNPASINTVILPVIFEMSLKNGNLVQFLLNKFCFHIAFVNNAKAWDVELPMLTSCYN
jgi:hypothetical protein